jgi:hypothetical protein
LRFLSFVLAAAAAVAFVLSALVKLAGGRFLFGIAPLSLWRAAIALLAFAIYALLYSGSKRTD